MTKLSLSVRTSKYRQPKSLRSCHRFGAGHNSGLGVDDGQFLAVGTSKTEVPTLGKCPRHCILVRAHGTLTVAMIAMEAINANAAVLFIRLEMMGCAMGGLVILSLGFTCIH